MMGLGNVMAIAWDKVSASQLHPTGHVVAPDNDGRKYVWGKFKSATTKGQPVAWKYSASINVFITTYASAQQTSVAGIAMASAAAAADFGWVQCGGLSRRNVACTGTCGVSTKLIWTETGKLSSVTATSTIGNWCALTTGAKSGTTLVAGRLFIKGVTN
jgi:hypothetical protein